MSAGAERLNSASRGWTAFSADAAAGLGVGCVFLVLAADAGDDAGDSASDSSDSSDSDEEESSSSEEDETTDDSSSSDSDEEGGGVAFFFFWSFVALGSEDEGFDVPSI